MKMAHPTMDLSSYAQVHRTIHFTTPTRLPCTGSMAETDFTGDTVALFPDVGKKWWLGGGGTDEWGSRWVVAAGSKDMGQVKNRVLENIADYRRLKIPATGDSARYAAWKNHLARAGREEKYVLVCNGPYIFERAHFLHGFADTLMESLAEPELMQQFLRYLSEYHLRTIAYIKKHFRGRIHGYRGTDDWGTQLAPLLSPQMFRAVFKPVYRDIFGAIRDADMDVWLHSCGQILPLMDDLIDAGLQVINTMQPNIFPIPALSNFRGRICFEVCADAQSTLLSGTPSDLAAEIGALIEHCSTAAGGIIEVKLDSMYYEGDGVNPALGEFCHAEYRRQDPFVLGRAAGAHAGRHRQGIA